MNSNESLKDTLFTKAFTENPYPAYEKLREEEPVSYVLLPDGQYAWIITRYEDALQALKDQRFIKDFTKLSDDDEMGHDSVFSQNMLFADMPDHKRLRGLVSKAFTPQMIAGMRERIQEITNELLDEAAGKDYMNLIDEFAFPLPIIVICEMLGIPTVDRDKFRLWSNSMIEGSNGEYAQDINQHMNDFVQYLGKRFAAVRENPGEDLISKLIISEEQGDQLTEQELYGVVSLLIIAGHETTVNLIGNSVMALLEHPDQLELLKSQPELINTAIEEALRYNDPVEFSTSRWAGESLEFKGKSIRKGDLVIVVLNSANHDPNQFDDPEIFDITRQKSKHLAFGKGIHACLGAPLARLEGEIAISSFFDRYPNAKLNASKKDLEWRTGMIVRGVKELPLSL
ncbi:cytochrome P450 family protein [Virgibacillus necropolis]|uniref:Cytochrome P450 n=1 Tax=Virgibacillus necropolis TaxID=163877 RepID=A0A221MGJ5_9BACI|nr:cytochrome P450 [Virgibacillus necropolis]ASN06754.1 cytochrome P450 [Virgibacillus necropolis]